MTESDLYSSALILYYSIDLCTNVVRNLKFGLAVTSISSNGFTKRLGFEVGDVLTHLNGEPIVALKHYEEVVNFAKPGTKIVIKYFRNGESSTVQRP